MEDLNRSDVRKSLIQGVNNKKNLCETLRLVYDEIHEWEHKSAATELLIDAMIMAKKMQNRLSYYQKKYKDNTGNKASNIVGLTGVNEKNRIRKAREL